MTNTKRLKEKIADCGLKQEYIARQLGLTSYGFARKRDNQSNFTAPEIDALCKILKLGASEMMEIFFAKDVE